MTKEQVRAFLEQDKIRDLIEAEDLDGVYSRLIVEDRSDLTAFLLSRGINPDEYMHKIPDCFAQELRISDYHISPTIKQIGAYAFRDCSSLQRISISEGILSIGPAAFSNCKELTHVSLPNTLVSIGSKAFSACYNLTSIILPRSVTNIYDGAFEYCYNLASITFSAKVKTIGHNSFFECSSLKDIYYQGTKHQWEYLSTAFKDFSGTIHCIDGDITNRHK